MRRRGACPVREAAQGNGLVERPALRLGPTSQPRHRSGLPVGGLGSGAQQQRCADGRSGWAHHLLHHGRAQVEAFLDRLRAQLKDRRAWKPASSTSRSFLNPISASSARIRSADAPPAKECPDSVLDFSSHGLFGRFLSNKFQCTSSSPRRARFAARRGHRGAFSLPRSAAARRFPI